MDVGHCKCGVKRKIVSPPPTKAKNLAFNLTLKDKTMTNCLPIGGRNPIGLRKTWVSIQEARHRVGGEQIMTCC